jgi:amino acid transporter
VVTIYLLANLAYLRLLPIDQIAGSRLVAADAAYRMVGDIGVKLVSLTVMISTFGTLNGSMMTGPRIFFAMAEDGLFFRRVASVHGRFKTPYVAISLAALLAIGFLSVRTFEQLADAFVLGIWPFYAGGVAAVYVLRKKQPDLPRPYRVWGYPFTPMFFIAAAIFLLTNSLISDSNAWIGFAVILAGIPVFYLWKK